MSEAALAPASSALADALAIARYHIVLVAMAACVVFGWLMTGRYLPLVALVVGLDWFLINLMNRITDIDEDLKNGIRGTERVARRKRLLTVGSVLLMVGSFVATHLVWPSLTPFRIAVQVIGLAYNYNIVPTPRGFSRLKEIYFFKNFGSSVLFVLTCFVYPLVTSPGARVMPWSGIGCLALFFVPFELTYEILYDMRDLEGDRQEGIPTYPVVHGPHRARQIIDGLLIGAAAVLVAGIVSGALGVREGLMLAAPATQLAFYRPRYRRGLTSHDCIVLTHIGTAQLVFYLVGTALWERAGMPANIFL
ncbi:UbiA family prenyltransferase [Polyangium sp. 6x1]|uniref:UbiA family prenyltransferase n=1 Tax=Polyangium sp. 6x1 TaxID=3042689 RepID=UPI0024821712|nr:UbiA family prenyltransferase [Polyangium sp. 6x1]MDI1442876.1 UbiA family prenyltransferase [Polyangium sp. 6x1]